MKLRVALLSIIFVAFMLVWSCNRTAHAVSHTVTLKWGPSVVSGTCTVATYNIYRSETSGGEGPIGDPVGTGTHIAATTDGTTLIFIDASVVNGHTYWYKLTAFPKGCTAPESLFSGEVGPMKIPADPDVLGAPPNASGVVN